MLVHSAGFPLPLSYFCLCYARGTSLILDTCRGNYSHIVVNLLINQWAGFYASGLFTFYIETKWTRINLFYSFSTNCQYSHVPFMTQECDYDTCISTYLGTYYFLRTTFVLYHKFKSTVTIQPIATSDSISNGYWYITLVSFPSFTSFACNLRTPLSQIFATYQTSDYLFQLRVRSIRLSEKFLSFYGEMIDVQRFLIYIILSNYVRSILLCWDKRRDTDFTDLVSRLYEAALL